MSAFSSLPRWKSSTFAGRSRCSQPRALAAPRAKRHYSGPSPWRNAGEIVRCRGNLLVQPHYTIADHPPIDLLVVPGGWGTRREAQNGPLLDWIAAQDRGSTLTLSVCTGAFLLAARGLLDGKPATTHWASLDRLAEGYPAIEVRRD